jgi:NAD(P)-dependent dehydrogenase (short-subunit alcohol dehydrogenase family)
MPARDLAGKVACVTGATSGIGFEIVSALAQTKERVLVHGRTLAKAEAACTRIRADAPKAQLVPVAADLSTAAGVTTLADQILTLTDRLDLLINNAGVYQAVRQTSTDGVELTYAVNVRAPVLLVDRLCGAPGSPTVMRATPSARLVTVSSRLHFNGKISDEGATTTSGMFNGFQAYANSKLIITLLTTGWAAREPAGGVTFYSAHPGWVATELTRTISGPFGWVARGAHWFALSAADGAQNILYPALAEPPPGPNGSYFAHAQPTEAHPLSLNPTAIAALEKRVLANCGLSDTQLAG